MFGSSGSGCQNRIQGRKVLRLIWEGHCIGANGEQTRPFGLAERIPRGTGALVTQIHLAGQCIEKVKEFTIGVALVVD
jgi:hypothetical protein